MADHAVAATADLADGERVSVLLEGREITVFNVAGDYYAYTNWCAHQSGPICEGKLSGLLEGRLDPDTREVERIWHREGEILSCPWHGWEFDATSGECLSRPGVKLIDHEVRVEGGDVVVSL